MYRHLTFWYVLPVLLCVLGVISPAGAISPALPGETVGCFVSTGDNDNLFYSPPVDSIASVEAYFDLLDKVYGVKRVYWRAMQADQATLYSRTVKDNFFSTGYTEWERHLNQVVGTGYHGVKAAHKRGMTIWGIAALFDHGIQDVVDSSKGWGPGHWECVIRAEHPEWVPVDKYGIRRQAGPICFAYPEARKALIDMYEDLALKAGYDGVLFFCYVENFQMRNCDEFCYNEPLVREYKRRYGTDIRNEPVDVYAMGKLRGEYLTQFFRELRQRFKEKNIQVGLCLSAIWPQYPQPWLYKPDLMVAGRVELDWRRYIREKLVDELHVYAGGTPYELVNELIDATRNTPVRVSMMSSAAYPAEYAHFVQDGVIRVIYGGYDSITDGYMEHQPASALDSEDFITRLKVLAQMAERKTDPNEAAVIKAVSDPHHFVRRQALKAMGILKINSPQAIDAARRALDDQENAVRCYAVDTLAKIGDAESVSRIFECLEKHHNFMIELAAAWGLANLPQDRSRELLAGLHSKNSEVRCTALEACTRGEYRTPIMEEIIKCALDTSPRARWITVRVLQRHAGAETTEVLYTLFNDDNPTVRSLAGLALAGLNAANTPWIGPEQLQALQTLADRFRTMNQDYDAPDAEWGWRPVGDALKKCGPRGMYELRKILAETDDPVLGDHAWQVLYIQQDGMQFYTQPMHEINQDYQYHPRVSVKRPPKPADFPQPRMMPYIVQNYESADINPRTEGTIGDPLDHAGWLRHVGAVPPAAVVIDAAEYGKAGRALQLTNGDSDEKDYVDAVRSHFKLASGKINIELSLYLTADSNLNIWFADSGRWQSTLRIRFEENGIIRYCGPKGEMNESDLKAPLRQWLPIRISVDLDKQLYSLFVGPEMNAAARDIELEPNHLYNALIFLPGGDVGSRTIVDDIAVTVSNPAWDAESSIDKIEGQILGSRKASKPSAQHGSEPEINDEASNVLSPKRTN